MSGDTQQDYITSVLELMAQKQFLPGNMPAGDREALETTLSHRAGELMRHYEAERTAVADLAADDARRKEFNDRTESLAKALPGITRGTLSAITAFQKNDPVNGSAAVMDICSSLAPMLGALSAAGGPPGMLVGAIFAMIGQILSFFAPKQESLTSQIAKLLKTLQAQEKQQAIKAAHTNITNYAASLKNVIGRVGPALDKPGLQIGVLSQIISDFNPIDGPTMTRFWEVTEWLQEESNQDLEQWPIVLAAVCEAYIDLMTTVIRLMSLISTDSMSKRFAEAAALPEPDRSRVQDALNKLLTVATARLIEYGAVTDSQLEYLRRTAPAARDRGMLWQVDDSNRGRLWAGTNIHKGGFTYLGGEAKRIAVAVARADAEESSRTYHAFAVEQWIDQGWTGYDRTYHCVVKAPYSAMDATELKDADASLHSLTDVWATAAADGNKQEVYLYTAKGTGIYGYALGEKDSVRAVYSRTLKAKATAVRVVHDPRAVAGDPDAPAQETAKTKVDSIAYGGCEASGEIYVDAAVKDGYVPSPWAGYEGIAVDRDYVWAFKADGVACATHSSVVRCLKGEIPQPRWMGHDPSELLYTATYNRDQAKVVDRPPLRGVVDLCASDDGTLVAALYTRTVNEGPGAVSSWPSSSNSSVFVFADKNALYGAVHDIDVKGGTLAVTWTKLGSATGIRVQKLPVFCWPLFASLRTSLVALSDALKAP